VSPFGRPYFLAERKQGQYGQLDALEAEWNSDYGDAQYDASEHIFKEEKKPSPQEDPEYIADDTHAFIPPSE